MRWLISISLVFILSGAGLVLYAMSLPVYTDAAAPERLSSELETKPRETRFKDWYSRLHDFETPHKKLSDFGRGLCAVGVGLLLAKVVWGLYHRSKSMRSLWAIFLLWLALWAVRIPFSMWYHELRQMRFDYPVWGDSIAIPVMYESLTWIAGALISSLVLAVLLIRHPLPVSISAVRPDSACSWIRAVFLVCWIQILGFCVVSGIPDGDEGMVITSIVASVILLAFLSARKAPSID